MNALDRLLSVGRLAISSQLTAWLGQDFEMEGVEVPRKVDGARMVAGV